MNKPQPLLDATLAVLIIVVACSLGLVVFGVLVALAWRAFAW